MSTFDKRATLEDVAHRWLLRLVGLGRYPKRVILAVTDFLTNSSISGATVAVNPNPLSGAQPGDSIIVTVSVPFNQVSWTQTTWFFGGINLTASTLMRREGIP